MPAFQPRRPSLTTFRARASFSRSLSMRSRGEVSTKSASTLRSSGKNSSGMPRELAKASTCLFEFGGAEGVSWPNKGKLAKQAPKKMHERRTRMGGECYADKSLLRSEFKIRSEACLVASPSLWVQSAAPRGYCFSTSSAVHGAAGSGRSSRAFLAAATSSSVTSAYSFEALLQERRT